MLKGQDIVLLLRLVSLWRSDQTELLKLRTDAWEGWEHLSQEDWHWDRRRPGFETYWRSSFTVRQLAADTGISKTQVAISLQRSIEVGLVTSDRKTDLPKANGLALYGILVHASRYLFPAKKGALARGIPTAMDAPVLSDVLFSGGAQPLVWAETTGKSYGQSIEPLIPSVPRAVKNDPMLYATLALLDSLRVGQPRERAMSQAVLGRILDLPEAAIQ